MKRLALTLACAFLAAASCGVSPEQACKDDAPVTCERMWTCSAAVKVGTDQASCVTQTQSLCVLAAGGCSNGHAYNAAKALECTDAKKKQTCAEYNAGAPAACAAICG